MSTSARHRRVNAPAYYLARPASLWLAVFRPHTPLEGAEDGTVWNTGQHTSVTRPDSSSVSNDVTR
jgi:hypothetical protein